MSTFTPGPRAADPGSIIPGNTGPGMEPPAPDPTDNSEFDPGGAAREDQPLSNRVGRDPSNLGDDVRDEGDMTYPSPDPAANNI